ncbi:MAG: alpha-ribazole phosphatase [Candidatus Omnitrophota bacterium]
MITKIFLIRHPETNYSREKRYCGITDIPLNNAGISQARKLSNFFENIRVDALYSSPQRRASQAAEILFGRKSRIILADSLRELNFGVFEGLTYEKLLKEYPKEYKLWLKSPLNTKPPCGESFLDLKKRVVKFYQNILQKDKGSNIAIVSHGGPIRVILCKALNLSLADFWNFKVKPAGISYLAYEGRDLVNFSLNMVSRMQIKSLAKLRDPDGYPD